MQNTTDQTIGMKTIRRQINASPLFFARVYFHSLSVCVFVSFFPCRCKANVRFQFVENRMYVTQCPVLYVHAITFDGDYRQSEATVQCKTGQSSAPPESTDLL